MTKVLMEWMRIEQHANDTISTEENLQAAGVKNFSFAKMTPEHKSTAQK